jgi:pimeloyl-ACP methyl ester carboxylesterase
MTFARLLPVALALPLVAAPSASPDPRSAAEPLREPEILLERVAPDSPLRIALHHLAPARGTLVGRAPVLLVHGATFPSALAAAYRLRGRSWMDDLAEHGFDTWALDFLGYGDSDRYPQMDEPPDALGPLGRTDAAVAQIAAAVRRIQAETGSSQVALVAHSWGTLPAGAYAASHPERVARLVLFGPLVDRPAGPIREAGPLPAYTEITRRDQRQSFDSGVPAGSAPPFSDADFAPWADLYFAAGVGDRVRVPFGPFADARDADGGALPYSPAALRMPTLLVRGAWDAVITAEDLQSLFDRLGSRLRRAVVLGGGTHRMHLEPGRLQLFREIDAFLAGDDEETR